MKKLNLLIIVILLSLTMITTTSNTNAYTETGLADWERESDASGNYIIKTTIDLIDNITEFTLTIPNSGDAQNYLRCLTTGATGQESLYIGFIQGATIPYSIGTDLDFDEDDRLVDPLLSGDSYDLVINFDAYEVPDGMDSIYIRIPTTTDSASLEAQLESEAYYTMTDLPLGYGEVSLALTGLNLYQGDRLSLETTTSLAEEWKTQLIRVPKGSNSIDLYGLSSFIRETFSQYDYVEYYDSDLNLVREARMSNSSIWCDPALQLCHDWFPTSNPVTSIAWSHWGYDNSTANIEYIRFVFYDQHASGSNNYLLATTTAHIPNTRYIIDGEIIQVNYYGYQGELLYSEDGILGTRTTYDILSVDVPEGKLFQKWIDEDAQEFDPYSAITEEQVTNGVANIYGVFIDDLEYIDPDPTDPTPDGGQFESGLIALGFNDGPERVIIFALVILFVSIALLAKGVQLFNILVVDGIITAFFISLGLIPTFASAIIIIILIFLGYKFLMAGGVSNE